MRQAVVLMLVFLLVPGVAFAQSKGKGQGRARPEKSASERAGEEVIGAVEDELTGEKAPSGRPPGLSKKEKLPPGLEKKGKTPPGWGQGGKEGWDKSAAASDTKHESGVRRLMRGLLRKSKETQQPPQ